MFAKQIVEYNVFGMCVEPAEDVVQDDGVLLRVHSSGQRLSSRFISWGNVKEDQGLLPLTMR